jgi:hypothetical protein
MSLGGTIPPSPLSARFKSLETMCFALRNKQAKSITLRFTEPRFDGGRRRNFITHTRRLPEALDRQTNDDPTNASAGKALRIFLFVLGCDTINRMEANLQCDV